MRLFSTKVSIFTHFFSIYTHAYAKKAVILQRELISAKTYFSLRLIYQTDTRHIPDDRNKKQHI